MIMFYTLQNLYVLARNQYTIYIFSAFFAGIKVLFPKDTLIHKLSILGSILGEILQHKNNWKAFLKQLKELNLIPEFLIKAIEIYVGEIHDIHEFIPPGIDQFEPIQKIEEFNPTETDIIETCDICRESKKIIKETSSFCDTSTCKKCTFKCCKDCFNTFIGNKNIYECPCCKNKVSIVNYLSSKEYLKTIKLNFYDYEVYVIK